MHEIEKLWAIHRNLKFPKVAYTEIKGVDLVSLDAFTAGCVHTFLEEKGQLSLLKISTLGLCYHDLGIIIPEITQPEAHEYFSRLEKLAKQVLESLIDANR